MSDAQALFTQFLKDVHAVWGDEADMGRRMEKTKPLFEALVAQKAMQTESQSWPSTEGHKNLLLHTDETYGFVINAVVRTPHRKGSVHDHSQAWVLYGLLEGHESLERYDRVDDGSDPTKAEVKLAYVTNGGPGNVDLVPPYSIHAEQGGPARSVALIFRSEVLVGRILQQGYNMETKEVVRRSGPTQIPFTLGQHAA